ncbi:MAG: FdtA/QdtA family cupin domain-containing protein [Nanoarchaeota archaeon]
MSLKECKLLKLPTFPEERGTLTVIEGNNHIPFDLKRIYYVYEVPENQKRGSHSNKYSSQVMIALNGKFNVTLDDGKEKKKFTLDNPSIGLYVPHMVWIDADNFTRGTIMLILRPTIYDKNDYIGDYEEFKRRIEK